MKKPGCVPLLALSLSWLAGAWSQEVVPLWSELSCPHSRTNSLIEREVEIWGTVCVRNVIELTLTIYPARGKDTGVGVVVIPGGNYTVVAMAA